MQKIVLIVIWLLVTSFPIFASDNSVNLVNTITPATISEDSGWTKNISTEATSVTLEIRQIKKNTPKEEVDRIIKEVLEKIRKMREYAAAKKHYC